MLSPIAPAFPSIFLPPTYNPPWNQNVRPSPAAPSTEAPLALPTSDAPSGSLFEYLHAQFGVLNACLDAFDACFEEIDTRSEELDAPHCQLDSAIFSLSGYLRAMEHWIKMKLPSDDENSMDEDTTDDDA